MSANIKVANCEELMKHNIRKELREGKSQKQAVERATEKSERYDKNEPDDDKRSLKMKIKKKR